MIRCIEIQNEIIFDALHSLKLIRIIIPILLPKIEVQMNTVTKLKILLSTNNLFRHFPNEPTLSPKFIQFITSSCENYLIYCLHIPHGAAILSPVNEVTI